MEARIGRCVDSRDSESRLFPAVDLVPDPSRARPCSRLRDVRRRSPLLGISVRLWLATLMLAKKGFNRILLLHGETPTRFADRSDRSVALLFGDVGSAIALEAGEGNET